MYQEGEGNDVLRATRLMSFRPYSFVSSPTLKAFQTWSGIRMQGIERTARRKARSMTTMVRN